MIKRATVAVILAIGVMQASAINKCMGSDGKVILTDKACPETQGTVGEDIQRKKLEKQNDDRLTSMARQHDKENKLKPVAKPTNAVECYQLSQYARARGHNFIEAAAIAKDAEERGNCVRSKD